MGLNDAGFIQNKRMLTLLISHFKSLLEKMFGNRSSIDDRRAPVDSNRHGKAEMRLIDRDSGQVQNRVRERASWRADLDSGSAGVSPSQSGLYDRVGFALMFALLYDDNRLMEEGRRGRLA
jgi:hypothetical protein